jgi:ArsR family transcriptional regulator, lead/cadmium/zinc/bismuth-responsive transcriptional repressor
MDIPEQAQSDMRLQRLDRIRELLPAGDRAAAELADFFKLFGDPTRIRILLALGPEELCVGEIAGLLGMQHSAISHQLRLLSRSGLVKSSKKGKNVYYFLSDRHIRNVLMQAFEHIQE